MRGIFLVKGLLQRYIGAVFCVNPTQQMELSGIACLKSFSPLLDVLGSANFHAFVRVLDEEIDRSRPPSTGTATYSRPSKARPSL